jgi:GNAT superfamily N-acetyltransferase
VIREFTKEDAKGLAQCYNESEAGWPGGFTGGVEFTADMILNIYGKEEKIAWLIALSDEKVVGISTLHPHYEDPNSAYLGILNVADKYRGKGFGKALLLESVKRIKTAKIRRLTLDTWPGNLNAVPVYKKTGFFWKPKTQVLMENYIPLALMLPLAKPYFDSHPDWYASYQRKIEITEDVMKHHKMHVYKLEWREGKDLLKIHIDQESQGPTSVETTNLFIECTVQNPTPPLGIEIPVKWQIYNKSSEILRGTLDVHLPDGFTLTESPPTTFNLNSGK